MGVRDVVPKIIDFSCANLHFADFAFKVKFFKLLKDLSQKVKMIIVIRAYDDIINIDVKSWQVL